MIYNDLDYNYTNSVAVLQCCSPIWGYTNPKENSISIYIYIYIDIYRYRAIFNKLQTYIWTATLQHCNTFACWEDMNSD